MEQQKKTNHQAVLLNNKEINKKTLEKIKQKINPRTKIMAVTKTLSIQAIESALQNNIYLIGESRVQETEKKIKKYKNRNKIKIHLIGHLQNNKVKKAIQLYDIIESVDSEKKINKINKEAEKLHKKQNIFLQINIGKDKNKFGFLEQDIREISEKIKNKKNIQLKGLMTILPKNLKKEKQKKLYKKMSNIQQAIYKKNKSCTELSMGMSSDYEVAAQNGSTQIRIGTLLYGKR